MNFTVTPAASQEILAAAERSNAAGMALPPGMTAAIVAGSAIRVRFL